MGTTHARSLVPVHVLVDPDDGDGSTTAFAEPDGTGRCADEHRGLSGEKDRCRSRPARSWTRDRKSVV